MIAAAAALLHRLTRPASSTVMAPGRGGGGGPRKRGASSKSAASRRQRTSRAVTELTAWACVGGSSPNPTTTTSGGSAAAASSAASVDPPLFELHTHSSCSDGRLDPAGLVARAHHHGVKVLALTDHDTMAGVAQAVAAAHSCGIRVVPAVEISSVHQVSGESVHILAYYGPCGPSRLKELDAVLLRIRDGRSVRAQAMVHKLHALNKPVRWERVLEIAGDGVAPGRPHVARALLEAGHVDSESQAFSKYLHDGGPAYASGAEPTGREVVELIRRTGGVAVLAHPWSLKSPNDVIEDLRAVGLHGVEVYRKGGKATAFGQLCDQHRLLKLGGSDFHGRGDSAETELGGITLPALVLHQFLQTAQPIWRGAFVDILQDFANASKSQEVCAAGGSQQHGPCSTTQLDDFLNTTSSSSSKVATLRNAAGCTLTLSLVSLAEEEREWLQSQVEELRLTWL